jgi:hypothetical protein
MSDETISTVQAPKDTKLGCVCDEMHFKPYTQPADIV